MTSRVQLYVSGSSSSTDVRDELSDRVLKTEGDLEFSERRSNGDNWRNCRCPFSGLFRFLELREESLEDIS